LNKEFGTLMIRRNALSSVLLDERRSVSSLVYMGGVAFGETQEEVFVKWIAYCLAVFSKFRLPGKGTKVWTAV